MIDINVDDEEQKVISLSWDPFNASRFISASGGSIKLWEITMDRAVMSLHRLNTVQFIRYNPNRRELVASGL
jgi:hypothetical protein